MSDLINSILLCSLRAALVPAFHDMPEGGDVVIGCPSDWECVRSLESAQLVDTQSREDLPFTVIQTGGTAQGDGWAVLRPDTPLAVGESVTAEFAQTSQTYRVVPHATVDLVERGAFVSLDFVPTPTTETVCCGQPQGTCGGPSSCTSRRQRMRARLDVGVSVPEQEATQWLYEVTFTADQAAAVTTGLFPWFERASQIFEVAGPDFCYELIAQSIKDGTRLEVESGCLVNGAQSLAEQDTPADELNETLLMCTEPPAGWQDDWCNTWLEACRRRSDLASCVRVGEQCDPLAPTGDGGIQQGDVDGGELPRKQGDGSACSVAHPGTTSSGVVFISWLALSLTGLRRRLRVRRGV